MPSVSIEDYIKTIYQLEAQQERPSTQRIAEQLGITMASVSGKLKSLATDGYLEHRPYKGVRLTRKGKSLALKLLRRHRLIELFLLKTLDLRWDEVHNDAEVLEHAVSDRLIERIAEYLDHPEFDPHGQPIPDRNGRLPAARGVPLDSLAVGSRGTIIEVPDKDSEFLRYLTGLGMTIGSEPEVVEIAPYDGPITLRLNRRRIAVGKDSAARIRIRPL